MCIIYSHPPSVERKVSYTRLEINLMFNSCAMNTGLSTNLFGLLTFCLRKLEFSEGYSDKMIKLCISLSLLFYSQI
jgi:hypothetical protein